MRSSGPVGNVAAPCARWQFMREPVRNGGSVRPLNSIVRRQSDAAVTIFDRLKVCAVLWAVLLLATGIADAFVDASRLREWILYSPLFWITYTGVGLLVAPLVAKYVPLKGRSSNSEGAQIGGKL